MANKRSREYLLETAIDIQTTPAIDANAVCYIPRLFSSIALPVRRVDGNEYSRKNGRYKLHLVSAQDIGLPYGTYPRLLLIHLTTLAKLTGEREIYLGNSMSQLFRSMGIINSGGDNGPLRAFKAQTKRLLAATLLYTEESTAGWNLESIRIANKVSMVWEPMNPLQWEAYIKLDETFFIDIAQRAVPIDKRVVQACSHYPLALDIYCWLTHRYFHMHQPQSIRWEQLANQFGNSYTRDRVFKQKFNEALARVSLFYPKARFTSKTGYLLLYPSPSHVPFKSHV